MLGAVCPATGHAEGLLSPQLNTKIVNTFLKLFSRTIPENEHAVMVWDGAGFHTSRSLIVPKNVTLVQLPPYSPELNPQENVWDEMREKWFGNAVFRDMDAVEARMVQALRALESDPKKIKSLS